MAPANQLLPFPPGSCFNTCETETHIVALYLGSSLAQSRQNLGTNVPGWEEHKEGPYNLGNALAPRCSVNGVVTFKPESYVERNDAGVVEMLCA